MFSYLYTPLLLILIALIVRGVALELRNREAAAAWRRSWDYALAVCSLLPALLLGVAFGNIFQGLPMDGAGYHGSLLLLLNPYGLATGLLFVMLFLVHGALWLACRTSGELSARCSVLAGKLWFPLAAIAVLFLIMTAFYTGLYANFLTAPVFMAFPLSAVGALLLLRLFVLKGQALRAFFASCAVIVMVCATGITGLYPNLIPSSLDPAYSLTIFNTSSGIYTLKIMTVVAFMFVPPVILYQIWKFRVFRKKVGAADGEY
jgi:cytochrome d ubiquinol oxidase subunit II